MTNDISICETRLHILVMPLWPCPSLALSPPKLGQWQHLGHDLSLDRVSQQFLSNRFWVSLNYTNSGSDTLQIWLILSFIKSVGPILIVQGTRNAILMSLCRQKPGGKGEEKATQSSFFPCVPIDALWPL